MKFTVHRHSLTERLMTNHRIKECFSQTSLPHSSITSWQIHGGTVETVADFIFLGSKITADCDCSHKIKREIHFLYNNLKKLSITFSKSQNTGSMERVLDGKKELGFCTALPRIKCCLPYSLNSLFNSTSFSLPIYTMK